MGHRAESLHETLVLPPWRARILVTSFPEFAQQQNDTFARTCIQFEANMSRHMQSMLQEHSQNAKAQAESRGRQEAQQLFDHAPMCPKSKEAVGVALTKCDESERESR